MLIFVMVSTVMSYYVFLEEYYLGKLTLSKFSGPDDLGITLTLTCFFTAYQGSMEFWQWEYDIFGRGNIRTSHFLIYILFIFNTVATLHNVISNLSAARNTEYFQKRFKLRSFIIHASYMVVLSLVYLSYTQLTPSKLLEEPKLVTLAFGGEYLLGVLRMMVSSVTQEDFTPYRRTTLISWSLLAVNAASFLMTGKPLINEFWMVLGIASMVWLAIGHYVYYVLEDFKRVLGIKVFTIVPKLAAETTPATQKKPTAPSKQQWLEDSTTNPKKAKKRN